MQFALFVSHRFLLKNRIIDADESKPFQIVEQIYLSPLIVIYQII